MTWNLVSDSSCDLRASSFHSGSVRFTSVPLHIQVGEQTFVDDDSLSVPAMLSAMAAEKADTASSTMNSTTLMELTIHRFRMPRMPLIFFIGRCFTTWV